MNKTDIEYLVNLCNTNHVNYKLNGSLKNLNTFHIDTKAEILLMPDSMEKSLEIEKAIIQRDIPFFLLGGGSNIIFSGKFYSGMILKLSYPEIIQCSEKNTKYTIFKVPASMRSGLFAKKVSNEGFTGAEFLATIPGTLGGAVVQNAGCYGGEISQILTEVEFSESGNFKIEKADELGFAYRQSIFKIEKKRIIHYLSFKLSPGSQSEINNKIQIMKQNRAKTQPKNKKNAGSIFKNPPDQKAWYYIQSCGLKGYNIGGAMVSPEHANFIVNTGKATSEDISKLIEYVQSKVYDKFHIRLVPEVEFVRNFR